MLQINTNINLKKKGYILHKDTFAVRLSQNDKKIMSTSAKPGQAANYLQFASLMQNNYNMISKLHKYKQQILQNNIKYIN